MEIPLQRVYIYDKTEARVNCPKCSAGKDVKLSSIKNPGKNIRVKCGCGCVFDVVFDRRRHYRKPVAIAARFIAKEVDISGKYTLQTPNFRTGVIKITDLSQGGIGFMLQGGDSVEVGDELTIEFRLTSQNQPLVVCNVMVCSLDNHHVGTRIVSIPQHHKSDLGFFLMP
jgi:hypothetical protein